VVVVDSTYRKEEEDNMILDKMTLIDDDPETITVTMTRAEAAAIAWLFGIPMYMGVWGDSKYIICRRGHPEHCADLPLPHVHVRDEEALQELREVCEEGIDEKEHGVRRWCP
jgi:hypothetical protein